MERRLILLSSTGALLPWAALAQKADKVWRIGWLQGLVPPPDGLPPEPLRKALANLGYIEGNNVIYTGRWAGGDMARLPALAAELVQSGVDVIAVTGWSASKALKDATSTIPVVIVGAGDAVAAGLVSSLSKPGGNLTGLTDMSVELSAKRMELLKETFPKVSRIAVLWNVGDLGMTLRFQEIERAAKALGVTVQAVGVRSPADFDAAFAAMGRNKPDALFMVSDMLTTTNRKRVIDFAEARRIPAMFEFSRVVQDGGLMSYGPDQEEGLGRMAYYIDRILKGAKPADLPMEQPTRIYFYLNQKTARSMGVKIPDAILMRTDKVIE